MIPQNEPIWIGVDWGDRAHTVCAVDAAVVEVKARLAQTTAKLLRTLQAQLDEYREEIETEAAAHPQARLVSSLPGAGPTLAPRLLAHIMPVLD